MASIGKGIARLAAALPIILRDLTGLAGAGMIAYGAWLIAPAAGFITGGVLVLAGCILVSIKRD